MSCSKILVLFLCIAYVKCFDDIDLSLENVVMAKLLRAMENQTKADTLNLPANSTSIRENITDTFSCDNRTYGYYADVDNECQVFHVCLPSQTPSGRNTTYRWSFICPAETIFNQEVLVCTRPIDAIDCEDSPMYYDINLEFGKVPENNDTNLDNPGANSEANPETNSGADAGANSEAPISSPSTEASRKKIKKDSRKPSRKQNLIVEKLNKGNLIKKEKQEFVDENEDMITVGDKEVEMSELKPEELVPIIVEEIMKSNSEEINETMNNSEKEGNNDKIDDMESSDRLISERSFRRRGRKARRGSLRFKADV